MRGGGRRRGRGGVPPGLAFGGVVALAFAVGCTSLPFAPEGGPGAAVTLVTLDTLAERERAMQRAFEAAMAEEVEAAVRAAREEDRARVEALAVDLAAHRAEIEGLAEQVAANADTSLELARVIGGRLQALIAESASLEARARALEQALDGMPLATLERLRGVLGAYVEAETAARAEAARAAAAKAGEGEAAAGPLGNERRVERVRNAAVAKDEENGAAP